MKAVEDMSNDEEIEALQDTVSGMQDLLDNLMTGTPPSAIIQDYHRLRADGRKLLGQD